MAPSLLSLGTAALALAGNAAAVQWYLEDTYNSTNFFDKFEFKTFDDPNTGYVNYLSRQDAVNAELATVKNNEVILRVDNKSIVRSGRGRDSVRLESKARLSQGLMIARFSHLPESACGTWPAFWTVGDTWPQDGEIDIIENWNLRGVNNPAYHMANEAVYGSCRIDGAGQTGELITSNCDNLFSDGRTQWPNQGCVVKDNGPSSDGGGVYAMEWTSDFIKVYSWFSNQVPSNIDSSSPDTSFWGLPTMVLKKDLCNIDKIFKPQRLVLNIALCGNPVEYSAWDTCQRTTGQTCRNFVANNPDAFDNVYFQVQDIRLFNQDAPKTTTTSVPTTSTTVVSSSAVSSKPTTASTSKETTGATSSAKTSTLKSSNSTLSTATKSAGSASISITSKASGSTVPTISTQVPVTYSTSVPSLSTRWPNSTIASSVEMTTSTVYTTSTHTITSCQPTVTNCPVGKVTTMTVPLYITICPVSPVKTNTPGQPTQTPANGGSGSDKTTITTKVTKTYTITSCAPTITSCPVGKVTTEVFTTTYCPDEEKAVPTGSYGGNNGNGGNNGSNNNGNSGNGGSTGSVSDKTTITTKVTKTYTITSCAPTITNCPVGKVTTKVFTTTYCPDEEKAVPTGSHGGNNGNGGNDGNGGNGGKGSDKTTITTKVTKIYTITSCAPTVTNCPVGKLTTEVVASTYYPGEEAHPTGAPGPKSGFTAPSPFHPSKTNIYNTQTIVPVPQPSKPSGGNNSTSNGTSIIQPRPSDSQVCVGPSCSVQPSNPTPNTGSNGCTSPNCPPTVVSGADKQSLSALVVLGAVAAMVL